MRSKIFVEEGHRTLDRGMVRLIARNRCGTDRKRGISVRGAIRKEIVMADSGNDFKLSLGDQPGRNLAVRGRWGNLIGIAEDNLHRDSDVFETGGIETLHTRWSHNKSSFNSWDGE